MPQFIAPFSVNDGSATPVAVVYGPERLSSGETMLVDRREASRDLQPSILIGFSPASATRATYKVTHDIAYPMVRVEGGVAKVQDIARAKVVYTLPKNATAQERKHIRAMVANLQSNVLAKAGIEDLDPLY